MREYKVKFKTNNIDWNSILEYDPNVPGCLKWKIFILDSQGRRTKARPGVVVGGKKPEGYYKFCYDGYKGYRHNRVIWEMHNRHLEEHEIVDHKDGNPENNNIENLTLSCYQHNAKNQALRHTNKSGVIGVSKQYKDKERTTKRCYWVAHWRDENNKVCQKWFSIVKYGDERAFKLACLTRSNAIDALKNLGVIYSDRHGTRRAEWVVTV